MFELIHESGWGAWFSLLLFVAGLAAIFTIGRRRGRPGAVAAAFAVAVLASGALGAATGQRKVDHYVRNLPEEDLKNRVEALTVGTREASSNLLLSGAGAMLLMMVGGALSLKPKKE